MPQRTAAPRSNPSVGVCASVVAELLPDDPATLKALLLAQQRAFEAREIEHQKALEAREAQQQAAFKVREAELQKAFEARILEIYEQLRLARGRMFGPRSESHAGQGWLFDEAEPAGCRTCSSPRG